MTEQEWLASTDPQAMLDHLQNYPTGAPGYPGRNGVTDRKLNLFREWVVGITKVADIDALPGFHWDAHCRRNLELRPVECADALRDIFGNPFRPVLPRGNNLLEAERYLTLDAGWLAWQGGTIPKLAQSIYEDRDFPSVRILGDALREAGCENEEMLNHCAEPLHVRGCWLLDLLLGKE